MAVETNKPNFQYVWASGGAKVAPSDVKVQTGWVAEVPPFQWENWSQNRQDEAILHLFQKGISEWDALSNYYFTTSGTRSYVQGSDGAIYVALQDSVGQNPISAPTYWQKAFVDLAALNSIVASSGPTVGAVVNLVASIPTAAATATFGADQLIVSTGLTGLTYRLNSFSKAINLATVGVGGMDSGAAPVNGFVAVYAAYNPLLPLSTTNPMLIGRNATVNKAPEVHDGVNMPAGYTASKLLTVLPTNGSSQFKFAFVQDRNIFPEVVSALSTTVQQGSFVALNIATSVPKNAKTINANLIISGSVNGARLEAGLAGSASPSNLGNQTVNAGNTLSGIGEKFTIVGVPLITEQTVYYFAAPSSGSLTGFIINTYGYSI